VTELSQEEKLDELIQSCTLDLWRFRESKASLCYILRHLKNVLPLDFL
jgi:hypothetical protein